MYKFSDLMILTPEQIKENARGVAVWVLRSVISVDRQGNEYKKIEMRAKDLTLQNPVHILTARFYGNNKNILLDECWIHCDCEYFQFTLEYALTAQGSSALINAWNQYPIEKNPELKGHLCKHFFASAHYLRNQNFTAGGDFKSGTTKLSLNSKPKKL